MTGAPWFIAGGVLSAIAAILHLGIIAGGPAWYRWFHAGPRMVAMAERGEPQAWLITLAIATVLAGFAAYGFSAAGLLPRLPLLQQGLVAIAGIYLLRGLALLPLLAWKPQTVDSFILWSSLVVLGYGIIYAVGLWLAWSRL